MEHVPHLNELTMWQLVQVLLAVANAMQRRMGMGVDGPEVPPEAPAVHNRYGRRHQSNNQGGEIQRCYGMCCVCQHPCVRLERGHKHCKCWTHMHTR